MDFEQAYAITLRMDEDDYNAIQDALSKRQLIRIMPDGDGNVAGRTIAEICRGWMEMLETRFVNDEVRQSERTPEGLLPCPFCGSTVLHAYMSDNSMATIECSSCGGMYDASTMQRARIGWNNRDWRNPTP